MYKRAFKIMYSFPLFEAGKPKREWKQFGFVSINYRACIKNLDWHFAQNFTCVCYKQILR